jgi:hypothetical protein
MALKLTRFAFFEDRTLGRLEYDGFAWWSIERPWLANKLSESCVPEGEYRLERHDSPRFGPRMWELQEVPGRTYILFHAANFADQLEGCIALGSRTTPDLLSITESKKAVGEFYEATKGKDQLLIRIVRGEVWS